MINKMEYIVYSCVFALFLAAYLIANTFPDAAASYPQMICIVGMVLTALLIGSHLLSDSKTRKDEAKLNQKIETLKQEKMTLSQFKWICIFMGMLLVYILCISHVGYYVSTAVYLLVSMLIFHKKFSWVILAVSVGFTGVMYFVFDRFLHILIPGGLLF